METTRYALFFLVGVCLWKTSCASSIQLCTDGPSSFVNGTDIPAMLGQPVSVVFCVQCDPRLYISQYIQIQHPHHPTNSSYYYTNNRDVDTPIIVNITTSANKATINITIKEVKKEDFNDQFSVKLHTNKSAGDNSVFIFRLSDTATSGTTTSETSLIPSTQPKTPAIISIRTSPSATSTELSTVSSRASTASTSTSTVGPTQDTTQCWPQNTSLCPANWYQVDKDTCLLVIREPSNVPPDLQCSEKYSSQSVNRNTIINLRSCLIKILGESKRAYRKYVVRVDNTTYVNVSSGADMTHAWTYSVVCTSGTLVMSTPVVPQCIPVQTSSCPQGWCEVHNDKCLIAINVPGSSYQPFDTNLCPEHSGNPVLKDNIIMFMECLRHILQQSEPKPINYEVRLGNSAYVNVVTRVSKSDGWLYKYNVACFQKKEYFSPVSLCKSEDASREMSPIVGGNVTFALCLMSSEKLTSSTNDTKIVVNAHVSSSARVYWTVNITMYNIQVNDYRTHTVKIANNYGSLDVHFTLKAKDNITWYTHGRNTENTTDTVSGLSSSTSYYLRVASWNQHRTSVDASTCTRSVFVTTKSLINHVALCEVPERSDTLVLTLGGCFLLVGMLFLSALICWRRKVNREHGRRDLVQGQVEIPMVATQAGPSTTPGEYETIGDLN